MNQFNVKSACWRRMLDGFDAIRQPAGGFGPRIGAGSRVIADGEYGVFEGAADDEVVFGCYRREGRWSAQIVALLSALLRNGGTLLDVGAHVGLVAIPVLDRAPARCLAFEPEPRNVAFLRRNIERHGLDARMEALPFALYSEPGQVRLALSADNAGDHRVLAPDAPADERSTVAIEAHTLDAWLDGRALDAPVAMKLDTQGCEARVLRGAVRTLASVDHIVTEFWPAGLARAGDSVEGLRAALAGFAFGCVLGGGRSRELVPIADLFASLAWIPADGSDEGFFDLFLSRHSGMLG